MEVSAICSIRVNGKKKVLTENHYLLKSGTGIARVINLAAGGGGGS